MSGYVASQFWQWFAAAFVLGLVVGAATWRRSLASLLAGWMRWAVIVFSVALLAASYHLAAGRWGLWLETGLWHFAFYIAGCWLGSWLRGDMAGPQPMATSVAVAAPASVPLMPDVAPPAGNDVIADEDVGDEHKPDLLSEARDGGPDDLKLIWGVGPKLEEMLHAMGVFHFAQIASWNEMNLRWVDQNLKAFKGRAVRDRWIEQCRRLETGWRPESDVGERPA